MKTQLIFGFLYLFLAVFTRAQTTEWLTTGGGQRSDKATTVVVDADGYSYVTGYYNEQAQFGSINTGYSFAHSKEVFVAKIDPDGNYVWVKNGTNYYDDRGLGLCLDPFGNVYVTGTCWGGLTFGSMTLYNSSSYTDQIYIVKLDANGNTVWIKNAGNDVPGYPYNDDHGQDIISDSDGNLYVTGFISNNSDSPFPAMFDAISIPLNPHDSLAFVGKITNAGVWQWVRTFDGIYQYRDNAVAVDDENNVYVAGGFDQTRTFGTTTLSSIGEEDIFVIKYDPAGNFVFVSQAGGLRKDRADGIAYGNDGHLYVTGEFRDTCNFGAAHLNNYGSAGGKDVFVAKISKNGTWKWAEKAGSKKGSDRGTGICVNNQGNVFVSGQFSGEAKFGPDILLDSQGDSVQVFVAGIDTLGNWRWAKAGGGAGYDRAVDVACDENCNVYFTGYYTDAMTFDSYSITATAGKEIFTGKMSDACFGYAPQVPPSGPDADEVCEIIAANVFSPNEDQINDQYLFSTNCNMDASVMVFNRWGEIVYESTNLMQAWDGRTPSGQLVQQGTYFYRLEIRSKFGQKEERSGFITVIY